MMNNNEIYSEKLNSGTDFQSSRNASDVEPSLRENVVTPVEISNNSSELFIDGPSMLAILLKEIEEAKHFIHFQVMLFYSDEAGKKIAKALAKKVEEGVQVRVMSDSELSSVVRSIEKFRSSGISDFSEIKKIFSNAGVKFVSSDNESYRFDQWSKKRKNLKQLGVPEEFLEMQDLVQQGIKTSFNVFDHRKILIFDGVSVILSGSNIAEKYLYEKPAKSSDTDPNKWHCGAVLIKGSFASVANKHFSSKWMVRGGDLFDPEVHFRENSSYGDDVCTAYSYIPGMESNPIRTWYLNKVRNCNGDFIIENPYINDEQFWKELTEIQSEQAKKIKLINPYKAKGNDYIQNESSIKCRMHDPLKNGVSFHAYQWRMTHWKIALDVDASEVMVGSYNLNHRSALHDFEMNVLIKSKNLAFQVKEMLERDIEQSVKITDPAEFHRYPTLHSTCLLLDATEYFE